MIVGSATLLIELVVLFFGVAFAIHLFQRRVGPERLRVWMGGSPTTSALKGIAIGFLTPFCTYSAIPMLIGLRRAGVPPAGYVAFISAAPVLDPVLFGALVVIVGTGAAAIYTAVALAGALTLALVAQRADITSRMKPLPTPAASPSLAPGPGDDVAGEVTEHACGTETEDPWQGLADEAGPAAHAALVMLRSVAPLLLAGVAIGLAIEATVSPDAVASITGDSGAASIPVAAAVGTPLYLHTGLFVPIADSLGAAGVGIGAIVALTISGAGANVPELVILTKLAEHRLVAAFFAYVFAVAVVGGLIAQALLA